ncbi:probable tRNA (uracil-O(2)-)-methyltransferase [Pogonomyrmex barbatus]|uniref:tRNA (uracil-O(2)-)-methyltransferase n=1 Tax=Pogonomyrmex barbatus TaxID=144034 RepID=A0A6I9WDZ3_9HYME|nr:probable tRNA (uracil-O(2)-)-methyltransferase [Pogonomyrmex barbatus]XP_025074625.1 probable tRNA (uracil-O(2)-)-methyltransferase [Pogonomyrmex barbatus]
MNFEQVVSASTNGNNSHFWKAIGIWMRNPHVVNRRVLASQELLVIVANCNALDIFKRIEKLQIQLDNFECDASSKDTKHLLDILNIAEYCQSIQYPIDSIETLDNDKTYLHVRKLLPRNTQIFSPTLEFVFIDKKSVSVTSLHKPIVPDKRSLGPSTAYRIQHREFISTCIDICNSDEDNDKGCDWLKSKFFPRLMKWMDSKDENAGLRINSLGLISIEKYTFLYNRLKEKYGAGMVKVWSENTDPAKFIYEDVAIATYLLLLWEKERSEKGLQGLQSFVDLGCGNGLLVYILSSEGHRGTGIDLRRRKIWDLFPESTHLQVDTIVPSSDTIFPSVDWIIGNHSDELTPWIPVIAARSSYECRFFLLPCCAYEFDGRKYQRYNAAESQYSEYMSYVRSICEGCGFLTSVDRLRIPSTKRTCFVGWKRTYAKENTAALDANIQRIINARSTSLEESVKIEAKEDDRGLWSASFKPRESTERTRNCTQLDRDLILEIINAVAAHLLRAGRRIPLERRPGETWNAGGQIGIGELAKMIAPRMLQQLRNECGGLQTLLKNHSHIFCVAQGKVQFRIPGTVDKKKKKRRNTSAPLKKVKPCWFHKNHPDGCPALEIDCDFQH